MSTAYAYPSPSRRPQGSPEQETRHVRVVSTRAQRRARPRVVYALATVIGFFLIFMAQLMLSIVTSDGAYQISALQSQQRSLAQDELALTENLALLGSQQNLATQAESLGMVLGSTTPVFLRLSDGAIVGDAVPGSEGAGAVGAAGSLVPNALLVDVPLVDQTTINATAPTAGAGTPDQSVAAVPSTPGMLPSPVTR